MKATFGVVAGSILIVSLFLLFSNGCASRIIYVHKGPPPLRVEVKTAPPHPQAVWISGYWTWDRHSSSYVWISGHWEARPKGRVWVPGYWEQTPRGWVWVKGHWQR
jgi:hypothetical protein